MGGIRHARGRNSINVARSESGGRHIWSKAYQISTWRICDPAHYQKRTSSSQTMPASPATGEEEIIDLEQFAHEEYLHNLFDFMSGIYIIVPQPQTLPTIPQTPSQPAKPHPQEVPSQTPIGPIIQPQVPMKKRKKIGPIMSCSQLVPNADGIIQKMRKTKGKGKSLSQGS
ncbi:hypothetical protein LIER_29250 [Lithospermum erythrorhizon]|uniref:Uncharacterized protein n=1 Tax=Lithospermum erythrorhizon TaxID=34254 RepID=A0AAV3RPG4_LITER